MIRIALRGVEVAEHARQQPDDGVDHGKGGGVNETFTVRKVSNGVGVERIFPLHSPVIADIEVVREGQVRRAKLYYLRNLSGKAARIRERQHT